MTAYYNENDRFAAQWLRELIADGHIAHGVVDERSIEDVRPFDLREYTQCHFFAGIGVWSYALRQAGWPDDRPVWTGSCPCQPFSQAGQRKGLDDERHLWPAFHWLIQQCRPECIIGEQVASKDGLAWLDLVSTDMEAEGYAVGTVSTVACGFGAPHKRQRLYWVAHTGCKQRDRGESPEELDDKAQAGWFMDPSDDQPSSGSCRLGDAELFRCDEMVAGEQGAETGARRKSGTEPDRSSAEVASPGPTNGFWRDADWLLCRDERWRAVEPGTFPLAHGAPARVGRLRGYGNAIVAQQAQAFIEAVM